MSGRKKPDFSCEEVALGMRFMRTGVVHRFTRFDGIPGEWNSIKGTDEPTMLLCGLTPKKELILINLFRFPVNEFCTELPGGTVEEGESLEVAAKREFLEETGYEAQTVEKLCSGFLWNGKSNQQFQIWVGLNCKKVGEIQLDEVEKYAELQVVLHKPHRVKALIADGDMTFDPPIVYAIAALESGNYFVD